MSVTPAPVLAAIREARRIVAFTGAGRSTFESGNLWLAGALTAAALLVCAGSARPGHKVRGL